VGRKINDRLEYCPIRDKRSVFQQFFYRHLVPNGTRKQDYSASEFCFTLTQKQTFFTALGQKTKVAFWHFGIMAF